MSNGGTVTVTEASARHPAGQQIGASEACCEACCEVEKLPPPGPERLAQDESRAGGGDRIASPSVGGTSPARLSAAQIATRLGLHPSTILAWKARGCPVYRVGYNRWGFDLEEVLAWRKEQPIKRKYNYARDLVGKRFGRLVVIAVGAHERGNRNARDQCCCDCGNIVSVRRAHLGKPVTCCTECRRKDRAAARVTAPPPPQTNEQWEHIMQNAIRAGRICVIHDGKPIANHQLYHDMRAEVAKALQGIKI